MDAWHNEGKINLKGTKFLGSNEKVTLEAYLRNRRTHREWNWNVQCWNEIEMNSNKALNLCVLKMVARIEMISKFYQVWCSNNSLID